MSTSGGTAAGGSTHHGRDTDRYEPEQQGVRNIAAHDGYDAGDGFQRPNPQLWPNQTTSSQSSYLPANSSSYGGRNRRRSSFDDYDTRRGQGNAAYGYGHGAQYAREYTTPRRNSSAPRGREYLPRDYSEDSESDFDYDDDERDRALAKRRTSSRGRASSRGRSRSNIRQKLQDMFSPDDNEMGRNNSEAKKWAATVAGAVAGGFAARTAKKDHWVPTALGAFIGGLTAREAEKAFYLHKDSKMKEQEAWEMRHGKD